MEALIVSGLAFLGAFLAIIAANAALLELSSRERRRLDAEVQVHLRQQLKEQIHARDFSDVAGRVGPPGSKLLARLHGVIDQSGVNVTPQRLIVLALLLAAAAAAAGWVLSGSLLMAMVAAVAASAVPLLYVLRARRQRLEKLLGQLPDTFELMSRVLRSGQTIAQAMQIVADQGSPPVSLEFYRCHEQMNLGMTPAAALRELATRTGLLEIKIFTVAVLVQRQAGGNLSELFDKMGTVVRERFRIRGMVMSLTAQGRLQGVILSALPVATFGLLMVLEPKYERQLLDCPGLLLTAIGLIAVGILWIQRVVNFDY